MKIITKINKDTYDISSGGERFKTPVEKRAKNSEFSKILKKMDNEELRLLCLILFGDSLIGAAYRCYNQAVEHGSQLFSLEMELKKRGFNFE